MFDSNFQLRRDFLSDPGALKRRFIGFGLVNLVLLPFTLLFMVMFFFLKNAEVRRVAAETLQPNTPTSPHLHVCPLSSITPPSTHLG